MPILLILGILFSLLVAPAQAVTSAEIDQLIAAHQPNTGLYVLEKGEESLLGRAWLVDHAQQTIDVQYFIWSSDNIGILAAESLLRAAERGVRVRVLVDDLLLDAPTEAMLALDAHPNIQIRIYNPVHKTGVSLPKRIYHLLTDFRNANQRMHDKTLIVDGKLVVIGGRNMADEYYDYDQHYNFRDRDLLVVGGSTTDVQQHFERFWNSEQAKSLQMQLSDKIPAYNDGQATEVYADLHAYAEDHENFAPPVREALAVLDEKVPLVIRDLEWAPARFVGDLPGKNSGNEGLGGGGTSTNTLAEALNTAHHSLLIQTPYLILPDGGLELLRALVRRGVKVRICTNSLGSTDNLAAFSGYKKQRKQILRAGVEVYEFKPDARVRTELIARYPELKENAPVFAIHAKTMVIDGRKLFVGTFNLDPRSANLNTEVGMLVESEQLAKQVTERIEQDMRPENSWRAGQENADSHAGFGKRMRLWGWRLLPLDALL